MNDTVLVLLVVLGVVVVLAAHIVPRLGRFERAVALARDNDTLVRTWRRAVRIRRYLWSGIVIVAVLLWLASGKPAPEQRVLLAIALSVFFIWRASIALCTGFAKVTSKTITARGLRAEMQNNGPDSQDRQPPSCVGNLTGS